MHVHEALNQQYSVPFYLISPYLLFNIIHHDNNWTTELTDRLFEKAFPLQSFFYLNSGKFLADFLPVLTTTRSTSKNYADIAGGIRAQSNQPTRLSIPSLSTSPCSSSSSEGGRRRRTSAVTLASNLHRPAPAALPRLTFPTILLRPLRLLLISYFFQVLGLDRKRILILSHYAS